MRQPLFTVVLAVYNVESYIRATLSSIEQQTFPLDNMQIIMVDDGSTDNSLTVARKWAHKRSNVVVLTQENQGPGAARKAALEHATGTWVTVVDPDDLLDKNYFSSIASFIDADYESRCDMLVTRILVLNGSTGRLSDSHPLGFRFRGGSKLVSINENPNFIQLGATAVLRRERLVAHGLTYDPSIEPTFEDAHLLGRYLSTVEDPVVGFVSEAKYYYRKRHDASSLVQSSWESESRYSTVLEKGYLDMLLTVRSNLGTIPKWAQHMVLYDLLWYFKEEALQNSRSAWIEGTLREEFLVLLSKIFDLIDDETISEFNVNPSWWSIRETIRQFYKKQGRARIFQWGTDSKSGTNQYTLLYSSERPKVQIFANGVICRDIKSNFTVHSYYGTQMMIEESFTVTTPGAIRILLDGRKAVIHRANSVGLPNAKTSSRPDLKLNNAALQKGRQPHFIASLATRVPVVGQRVGQLNTLAEKVLTRVNVESLALSKPATLVVRDAAKHILRKRSKGKLEKNAEEHAKTLIEEASQDPSKARYKNAWVLMDRPMRADDNGEHLYRFLMHNRPEINKFFLLSKESADWDRLEAEGFNLIAYGSDDAVRLVLNCDFRISSDATADVMYPMKRKYFKYNNSKFIFLQHGVIMNDLSRWLNPKDINSIICTTQKEYEALAGQKSPYTFKSNQVKLTGLARYDSLWSKNSFREECKYDLTKTIMVMPTWRQSLRDELRLATSVEDGARIFMNSDFATNWMKLLNSPALIDLVKHGNCSINFVAHPGLDPFMHLIPLPPHVNFVEARNIGFQDIISESSLFLTDYSSLAFDFAYLRKPVVYFQFDADEIFSGKQSYRKGYFDYAKDGMGPVAYDANEAVEYLSMHFEDSSHALKEFEVRRENAFKYRDDRNSERIVAAIEEI